MTLAEFFTVSLMYNFIVHVLFAIVFDAVNVYNCLLHLLLCSDRREGGNKRCFCPSVRLSVCPSVAYIANNSRTRRPSVPEFGRKVPHLRCDSLTGFKVKRSKVRVRGGRGHTVSAEPGGHAACSVLQCGVLQPVFGTVFDRRLSAPSRLLLLLQPFETTELSYVWPLSRRRVFPALIWPWVTSSVLSVRCLSAGSLFASSLLTTSSWTKFLRPRVMVSTCSGPCFFESSLSSLQRSSDQ